MTALVPTELAEKTIIQEKYEARKKAEKEFKDEVPKYYKQHGNKGERNVYESLEAYQRGDAPTEIHDKHTSEETKGKAMKAYIESLKPQEQ